MSVAEQLVHRRGWVVGAFAVLAAVLLVFVPRFEINASADTLLSEGNRDYLQARLVQQLSLIHI